MLQRTGTIPGQFFRFGNDKINSLCEFVVRSRRDSRQLFGLIHAEQPLVAVAGFKYAVTQ